MMTNRKPDGRGYTLVCTVVALLAFAANSVLCRMALGDASIGAAEFLFIRIASGAVALWLIMAILQRGFTLRDHGDWVSATALFLYASAFSFAYLSLSAGTGALILFGAVQATMMLATVTAGTRPGVAEWLGLVLAMGGLVYLLFPDVDTPSAEGGFLMLVSGVAWGIYSLRGRATQSALAHTTGNFIRSVPLVALVLLMAPRTHSSFRGMWLAVLSGALASGVGYAIWYAALRGLAASRAAIVQLSVPLLAAGGGVWFLAETVTSRILLASVMILGGIGLSTLTRQPAIARR